MTSYNVDFKPSVHKDFRGLPKSVVERVMKRIEKLKDEPFPHGVEKLEETERLHRIRGHCVIDVCQLDQSLKAVTQSRCLGHFRG